MDYSQIITILWIPLAGTVIGAACVFFQKQEMPQTIRNALMGFAAGVMVAASVWSLLIPSMDFCASSGPARVLPATVGFFLGIFFLLCLDLFTPHQHIDSNVPEGPHSRLSKTSKLALAVTIHNIPEGIAVGISLAGAIDESAIMSMSGAMALAIGISIQNFPEGAIVSMTMRELGNSRRKSFTIGALSGLVEPVASIITIWIASMVQLP